MLLEDSIFQETLKTDENENEKDIGNLSQINPLEDSLDQNH